MNHNKYLPCTKLSGPMVGLGISKTVRPKMSHIMSLLGMPSPLWNHPISHNPTESFCGVAYP